MTSNEAGAAAIYAWLNFHNIKVTWSSKHYDYIKAKTHVSVWERVLNTEFHMYRHSKNQKLDHIPRAQTYHIPSHMEEHIHAIFHVSHLPPPITHHGIRRVHPDTTATTEPSTVDFLNDLYNVTSNLGSSHMSQSVFETADEMFSQTDLKQFQEEFGLTVQAALNHGGTVSTSCTVNSCGEGNLDIQYIMGIAQQVVSTYWYVDGSDPFVDFVTELADMPNPPLVNSMSWGSVEQVRATRGITVAACASLNISCR